MGLVTSAPMALVKVTRPAAKALMPKPSCSKIANIKGTEPSEKRNKLPPNTEIAKLRTRSSEVSRIG